MADLRPILHALAWPGELAGIPRSVEETLAAQGAAGERAAAWLVTEGPSPAVARFERRGLPVHPRWGFSAADPGAIGDLVHHLRLLGRGAVLHSHGERALLWGTVAARLARVPHVHTLHGFVRNTGRDRARAQAAQSLVRGCQAVVAVHDGIDVRRAVVVPNTLDPLAFASAAPPRSEAREALGVEPGEAVFLVLGRLGLEKGADRLRDLAAALRARRPGALLFAAGRGAVRPDPHPALVLLGPRSDAAALLAAADVLLMPSRSEGLPMVLLEARALGLPAAGFAVGGLRDPDLAHSVDPGDVDALADLAVSLAGRRVEAALPARCQPAAHAASLRRLYQGLR